MYRRHRHRPADYIIIAMSMLTTGTRGRIAPDALGAIGNTSLVELRRVVPSGAARIVGKAEYQNPTGSMKDRVALSMIAGAQRDGLLAPGDTVVEYTAGSTGASLALVCAVHGYRLRIVTSEAFSEDKLTQMQALGAELILVPSVTKGMSKQLISDMIEEARRISVEPNTYWTDQFNNTYSAAGYWGIGDELWAQTEGHVDAFVHSVGTSHSLRGTGEALRRHNPSVAIIAVEPSESPVLSGGSPGVHRIEGIGTGRIPPMWDPSVVSEIMQVSTDEAEAMARRLAREEGLFVGTSSGANVVAAIRLAERLGRGATVATLLVDSGLKYLNTKVYARSATRP